MEKETSQELLERMAPFFGLKKAPQKGGGYRWAERQRIKGVRQKGNMLECRIHKGTLLQNWTRYASAGTATSIYCPICSPELRAEHLHAAQQSVQPTAFGVGKRGHLANLLVSLGKYLVKIGGG